MCLIIFSHKSHEKYKLVIAGNRDEFYERPTQAAEFWERNPSILAGKDLTAGGTWMGVTKSGKIAMITNYRDLKNSKNDAPSRGHLVSDFLLNNDDGESYLNRIDKVGDEYNGYNLITGTTEELYYSSNYSNGVQKINPGLHGLSNHLLNSPWPKLTKAKNKVSDLLLSDLEAEDVFSALYDSSPFQEHNLPDTGVGKEMEKMLSPIFIKSPKYGSRTSTFITVDWDNNLVFHERSYDVKDFSFVDNRYKFKIES